MLIPNYWGGVKSHIRLVVTLFAEGTTVGRDRAGPQVGCYAGFTVSHKFQLAVESVNQGAGMFNFYTEFR